MVVDYVHGFIPRDYLYEYYSDMGAENKALLRFLARVFIDLKPRGRLLDFGSGPTVYQLISACTTMDEIHVSDYLQVNLDEIDLWLKGSPEAFDWHEFVRTAIELEDGTPDLADVKTRVALMRKCVKQVVRCDAQLSPAIADVEPYDVVLSNFCAESISENTNQFRHRLHNIVGLLKPGGLLIIASLLGASGYKVGDKIFTCAPVQASDWVNALIEEGFCRDSFVIESISADRPSRLYEGMLFIHAKKCV